MKKYLFFFSLCIFYTNCFAQNFQWVKSMGGTGSLDFGNSTVVEKSGNIYYDASFQNTVDFDPGPGVFNLTATGTSDICISKLNTAGDFLWAKQIASVPTTRNFSYCLTLDSIGNIYLTGSFKGTVDFDPGPAVHNLTSVSYPFATSTNVFILKLDNNGNYVWAKNMGGSSGESEGRGLAVDRSGSVFIGGYFYGTIDFDPGVGSYQLSANSSDGFLAKLDANGNFSWALNLGGGTGGASIAAMKLDSDENIYIAGGFSETTDFDMRSGVYEVTAIGINDVYVSKLDHDGNFLWAKTFGSAGNDFSNGIQVDSLDNVYISGAFSGLSDFDPGPGTYMLNSAGAWDAYVWKLDHDGNFLWAKTWGSASNDDVAKIALDVNRNVYLIGKFWDTIDADPGPGTYNLTSLGVLDVFIIKMDEDGNFIWAVREGNPDNDLSAGIGVDSLQNVYALGAYAQTVDFDPGPNTYELTSNGGYDIFVLKLGLGTLPVSLLDFNIGKNNKDVCLTWQTSSESNSYKFEIERSLDGSLSKKLEKRKEQKIPLRSKHINSQIGILDLFFREKRFITGSNKLILMANTRFPLFAQQNLKNILSSMFIQIQQMTS
ncbi:MAG: hypothetical protein QM737_09280 [Ferruginibacter sp.]